MKIEMSGFDRRPAIAALPVSPLVAPSTVNVCLVLDDDAEALRLARKYSKRLPRV